MWLDKSACHTQVLFHHNVTAVSFYRVLEYLHSNRKRTYCAWRLSVASTDELEIVKTRQQWLRNVPGKKKKGVQNLVGTKEIKVRTINERWQADGWPCDNETSTGMRREGWRTVPSLAAYAHFDARSRLYVPAAVTFSSELDVSANGRRRCSVIKHILFTFHWHPGEGTQRRQRELRAISTKAVYALPWKLMTFSPLTSSKMVVDAC